MRKSWLALWTIVAVSFIASAYYYPQVPERMVTHWGMDGEPNGHMGRVWGMFMIPLMMAGLGLLFMAIPRIDPLRENVERFRPYFEQFVLLIFVFLLFIQLLMIFWNIGFETDIGIVMMPWLALLFFYAGVLMKKSERNWFIGVRTPWTLSSDRVWEKTNKRAGTLFQISAGIMLLGFLLREWLFPLLILLIASLGVYIVAYSYIEYQKELDGKGQKAGKL